MSPPAPPTITVPASAAPPKQADRSDAGADAAAAQEERDPRVTQLHASACEADVSGYPAVVAAFKAQHPIPDPAAAFAEHKQRCESGEWCGDLADDYAGGHGVPRNPARAAALYKKDCDKKVDITAGACARLGDLAADGAGVPRDRKRAASLYEYACSNGAWGACLSFADMARAGDGAKRDEAHAVEAEKEYLRRARNCCWDDKASWCCGAVARAIREGRGGEKVDEAEARDQELLAAEAAHSECQLGMPEGCAALAERYAWGRGVPSDGDCARKLWAQACAGGHAPGCVTAWPSPMPSEAEWSGVGEIVVKHSSALGCETKMVREWLRVRCTAKDAQSAPVDGRYVRGESAVESFTERGGGAVTLLTSVRAGADIEARVVWPKTGIRTLRITWPKGAASPTMGFDRGK